MDGLYGACYDEPEVYAKYRHLEPSNLGKFENKYIHMGTLVLEDDIKAGKHVSWAGHAEIQAKYGYIFQQLELEGYKANYHHNSTGLTSV